MEFHSAPVTTGALLAAVLSRDPAVRGTLVEQPGTAARARERFTEAGLADRAAVIEGSFFDALPTGGTLYVLAQVIHDWPDEDAVRILQRCADALRATGGATGRVALIERLVDAQVPDSDHVLMDLRMLTLFGSAERTHAQFADLAGRADLTLVGDRPIGHGLSLLTLDLRADTNDPGSHR